MPNIQNVNSREQGMYRQLDGMWEQIFPDFQKQYENFFLDLGTEGQAGLARTAKFAWKESLPFPKRWDRGQPRQHQAFKDTTITVPLYRYETTLDVDIDDAADDQLGSDSAQRHMSLAVRRYLNLIMKLYSEYLNGATSLLPSLETAYDGANLYATTDGDGAARFGVTNGNLLSGTDSGTVTKQGMVTDLFNAHRQFIQYQDTANEIIFDSNDCSIENFVVSVPQTMAQVANEVSESEYLRFEGSTDGGIQNNVVKGRFEYEVNPYLTDNDNYFITLKHPYWKPMVKRQDKDVQSIWGDRSNSDKAKEYNVETLYTDVRNGVGVWAPFTTIKINN